MDKGKLGFEVQVNHYLSVSVYLGCKIEEIDEKGEKFHEFCSYSSGERYPFEPEIQQTVGVFSVPLKKWVRAQIKDIYQHVAGTEYKVFLLDYGEYKTVKKNHVVKLNKLMEYPYKYLKMGLHGVVPEGDMCQNYSLFLTDLFHKGAIYFKERKRIEDMVFGDVIIKPFNNDSVINLTATLLEKELVRISDNFEEDIRKCYFPIEQSKQGQHEPSTTSSKGCEVKEKSQPELRERTKSPQKVYPDTGYSSSDDSQARFVRDDTVFLPAGYQYVQERKTDRRSRKLEKPPLNYYQLLRNKKNDNENRSKNQTNPSDRHQGSRNSRSCTRETNDNDKWKETKSRSSLPNSRPTEGVSNNNLKEEEKEEGRENHPSYNNNQKPKEHKFRSSLPSHFGQMNQPQNQSVFQPKRVSWGSSTCQEDNPSEPSDHRPSQTKTRAFNLNFKLEEKKDIKELSSENKSNSGGSSTNIAGSVDAEKDISKIKVESSQSREESSATVLTSHNKSFESPTVSNSSPESYTSRVSVKSKLERLRASLALLESGNYPGIKKNPSSKQSVQAENHEKEGSRSQYGKNISANSSSSFNTSFSSTHTPDSSFLNVSAASITSSNNNSFKTASVLNVSGASSSSCISSPAQSKVNLHDVHKRSDHEITQARSPTESKHQSIKNQVDSVSSPTAEISHDHHSSFSKEIQKQQEINKLMAPTEKQIEENNRRAISSQTFTPYSCLASGGLVHSKDNQIIPPITTLRESCLDDRVIKRLMEWNLRELSRIEMFSYPTISARRNVVMIGAGKSGKTAGYVVPLASNLLDDEFYNELPNGHGPRVIVITPHWKNGQEAANMFLALVRHLPIYNTYGGGAELELKMKLLQGCDVLVSTPRSILRLLNYKVTELKRLCHFVMDDADVLFDKFKPEMEELVVHINKLDESRDKLKMKLQLQVIIAASKWTSHLNSLTTRILSDTTICIVSHLEACVYAGIKPTAVFLKRDRKMQKLFAILNEINGQKRTVVMCKNKDVVISVYNSLKEAGMRNVLSAHEEHSSVNLSEVPIMWNKSRGDVEVLWNQSYITAPILVRSDDVLEEFPVRNAHVLIHYDMPNNLTTFDLRFSCLVDNYPNVLKKEVAGKKCQIFIFMDEENHMETPGVMQFMTRLGTVLPESVQEAVEKIEQMKQQEKITEPLCEDLKQFGVCWDMKRCHSRHIVSKEQDLPKDIPVSGEVKILVQHVHDACHYSVRLLEHAPETNKWEKLPSEMMSLSLKLNNFYGHETNKRLHGLPVVGDLVAMESSLNVFQRAVVQKITNLNKQNEPMNVNVRLIDNGSHKKNYPVMKLYNLPEDLKKPPAQAIDVYLCNIMPTDLDTSWNAAMGTWVEQQLREAERNSPNGSLVGKIVLSLGRSLWLEPLNYMEDLVQVGTTVFRLSLRQDLLNLKNAVENPNHIPSLKKLCQNAGIEIREEEVKVVKPSQPKPSWAWIPQEKLESVYVTSIFAPDVILLRLNYFNDCLQKLIEEIQTYVKEKKDSALSMDVKLLDVGDICLGKSGDEWNRAMIRSKVSEDQVELFFVDYGDFAVLPWSEVVPISNKLITKLPFQVIECHLAGVLFQESDDEGWEDDLIDQISDLTKDSDGNTIHLQVKVCAVESIGKVSEGRRYKVVLLNTNDKQVDIINKKVISLGIGQLLEKEAHLLEPCTALKGIADLSDDSDLDCASEQENSPNSQNIEVTTTVQHSNQCQVLLPQDFNLDDKIATDEKEQRVLRFLKDLESGQFEFSNFPGIENGQLSENDADISENENHSEGSVLSLPQSKRSLPQLTGIFSKTSQEKISVGQNSSSTSSTSHHGSLLSVNEEKKVINKVVSGNQYPGTASTSCQSRQLDRTGKETRELLSKEHCESVSASTKIQPSSNDGLSLKESAKTAKKESVEILNQDYLESINTSVPSAQSSPKNEDMVHNHFTKVSPINKSPIPLSITIPHGSFNLINSSLTPQTKQTGKNTSFADLVSPSLLSSSASSSSSKLNLMEKVKPFIQHLSSYDGRFPHLENDIDDASELDGMESEELVVSEQKEPNENNLENSLPNILDVENLKEPSCDLLTLAGTGNAEHEISNESPSQRDNSLDRLDGEIQETNESINETPSRKWIVNNISTDSSEEEYGLTNAMQSRTSSKRNLLDNSKRADPGHDVHFGASGSLKSFDGDLISSETRYPVVEWHQNDQFIWIYVRLPAIPEDKYKFTCNITSIEFSAIYKQLPFKVNLELFAGHKCEAVQYAPKAFYFEIRLEKLLKGKKYHWPRLIASEEKFHWLKLNVEKAYENMEDSEDEDIKRLACSLPMWNDNPEPSECSSDVSEAANSELSMSMF